MKPIRSIVIGTAGHIDHGKTALVRALTGIDTDRLPEEKRRGITIDLGFASLDAVGQDGSSIRISFVDVPGHALFIRNMLAGAGCVPAVMLVIAADEGVMPQTREHLAICELLGMSDGLTVISKADLVDQSQLDQVRGQIREFLKGTFLGNGKPILVASARTGFDLAQVKGELVELASSIRVAEQVRPTRMPIDRVFVKKGFGTVVTGTLLSGQIRVGENLMLEPGSRAVRVRGLQTHGESEEIAQAGSRTAVNLSGVDVADVARGQVLLEQAGLKPTSTIDAEITLLEDAPALKHCVRVHFHSFTSEVMAGVFLYGNETFKPGSTRLARLKLSEAIVLVSGDRFVLRQPLPAGTVAGGRVLDAHPLVNARRVETQKWLEQIAAGSIGEQVRLRVQRRGAEAIEMDELAREMGLRTEAVREIAAPLVAAGELMMLPSERIISSAALWTASDSVLSRLKIAGAEGLKRSVVQSQSGLSGEVFDAVIARLVGDGKAQVGGEIVTIAGVASAISAKDAQKLQAAAAAYRKAGLAAPSVKEVGDQLRIGEAEMRKMITLLIREKTLMRMGSDDVFVHAEALRELTAKLGAMRGKTIDVGGFKAMTGLTRKHVIPLLELLDRERITRKQGDVRVVL